MKRQNIKEMDTQSIPAEIIKEIEALAQEFVNRLRVADLSPKALALFCYEEGMKAEYLYTVWATRMPRPPLKPSLSSGGAVWVKASDRWPAEDKNSTISVKLNGKHHGVYKFYGGCFHWWHDGHKLWEKVITPHLEQIEWLDESGQSTVADTMPSKVKDKEKGIIENFLQWTLKAYLEYLEYQQNHEKNQ